MSLNGSEHPPGLNDSSIATSQSQSPQLSLGDHEHEGGDLVEKCQTEELALTEAAVMRVLRREKLQPPVKTDSTAAQVRGQEVQEQSRDKTLLLGLLQEVRLLRSERKQRQAQVLEWDETGQLQESACRFRRPQREGSPPQPEQGLNVVVEAAAHAAVAAAEAAKAAATSVKENSAAIQSLVMSLKGLPNIHVNADSAEHLEVDARSHLEGDKAGAKPSSDDSKIVELAKVVHKQNRITHWLLGLMVVTTALWRIKTVSVVMKLQKKLSNPVESLQSMFGGDKDESSGPPKLPGFQEMATLLQGDPETGKPGLFSTLAQKEDEGPAGRNDQGFPISHLFPHHAAHESAKP